MNPARPIALALLALTALAAMTRDAFAVDVAVAPGESVQVAIDAAEPGDVILLGMGRYDGDIDFRGKPLSVRGAGPGTVLRGTGLGPVVTFATGEDERSVIDSVTIRGGRAARGGGIYIRAASPVVVRCVITRNRASSQGSGVWVGAGSRALLFNNLVTHNRRSESGDPHGIEIVDAAPSVVNNTICRGDSNGLILRGDAAAVVLNNIFAWNGSRVGGQLRGRGICDFSGGAAYLLHNVFHRNRIAALLRDGRDFPRINALQNRTVDVRFAGNRDGNPGFRRAPARAARASRYHHYRLRRRGRAPNRGLDAPACRDLDDSRNDVGHTGGPYARGSAVVPGRLSCGASPP